MDSTNHKGAKIVNIVLSTGQKGVIAFDSQINEWEAKIYNPYNSYGPYPMESLGLYKSVTLAESAINYFYTICIGQKGLQNRYILGNNEEQLKVKIAALKLRLQTVEVKNRNLRVQIRILEHRNQGLMHEMVDL